MINQLIAGGKQLNISDTPMHRSVEVTEGLFAWNLCWRWVVQIFPAGADGCLPRLGSKMPVTRLPERRRAFPQCFSGPTGSGYA